MKRTKSWTTPRREFHLWREWCGFGMLVKCISGLQFMLDHIPLMQWEKEVLSQVCGELCVIERKYKESTDLLKKSSSCESQEHGREKE